MRVPKFSGLDCTIAESVPQQAIHRLPWGAVDREQRGEGGLLPSILAHPIVGPSDRGAGEQQECGWNLDKK
jgi:hypothetical protein